MNEAMNEEIQLGDYVSCKITGFTGRAISHVIHLHGASEFFVRPTAIGTDGKYPEGVWIQTQGLTQAKVVTQGT